MKYIWMFLLLLTACGTGYENQTIEKEDEKKNNQLLVPPFFKNSANHTN